jgi:hypothetical protein
MEGTADIGLRETWDRLILLLIAQPREGWEAEFEELIRREIDWLAVPAGGSERDERP